MNIHIINYEIGIKSGILTKFADMMVNELIRLGENVTVSNKPKKADINHHINYQSFQPFDGVNTTMVTHLDSKEKIERMKEVSKSAFGVCFSQEAQNLLKKNGVENTTVILPATSMQRRPRIVAILTQLYPDGRKREGMFLELLKKIHTQDFLFNIVGEGWGTIVEKAKKSGFHIQWQEHYTPVLGQGILNNADYLLYLGKDEGAMSVLDAKMCGVSVIAPLTGFHKEIGIEHPFDTQEELDAVFERLATNPVDYLTWERYTKEHVTLWQKLLS